MKTKIWKNQLSEHLKVYEVLPYVIYEKNLNESDIIKYINQIDQLLLHAFEMIRSWYEKPIIVNNYWKLANTLPGSNQEIFKLLQINHKKIESGLRTPECLTYNKFSLHTIGRALDLHFENYNDCRAAYIFVKDHYQTLGITGVEFCGTWLHIDTRYSFNHSLLDFSPSPYKIY